MSGIFKLGLNISTTRVDLLLTTETDRTGDAGLKLTSQTMTGAGGFASGAVITIATICARVMQHQWPPTTCDRAVTYSVWRVICDRRRAVCLVTRWVDGHLPLRTNAPDILLSPPDNCPPDIHLQGLRHPWKNAP